MITTLYGIDTTQDEHELAQDLRAQLGTLIANSSQAPEFIGLVLPADDERGTVYISTDGEADCMDDIIIAGEPLCQRAQDDWNLFAEMHRGLEYAIEQVLAQLARIDALVARARREGVKISNEEW